MAVPGRRSNAAAVADVDDLLTLRGLVHKRQGRRGGYKAHQRMRMWQSLAHIQNLWLTMAALETYNGDDARPGKHWRKPITRAIQNRAFIITDLMGQLRLDGFVDVEKFIFRPGQVFAHFLAGPGRQTALLSAKALQYDPYRQTWEKRLTRYLSWQWCCEAHTGNYLQPFAVTTLLTAVWDPDRVAGEITYLAEAGFDGLCFSLVAYNDELPYFLQEVLPRLERLGLRQQPR